MIGKESKPMPGTPAVPAPSQDPRVTRAMSLWDAMGLPESIGNPHSAGNVRYLFRSWVLDPDETPFTAEEHEGLMQRAVERYVSGEARRVSVLRQLTSIRHSARETHEKESQ